VVEAASHEAVREYGECKWQTPRTSCGSIRGAPTRRT
jgi:hypothetical protein